MPRQSQNSRTDDEPLTRQEPRQRRGSVTTTAYALCFSSAEDAADEGGPSEADFKPSAVDLVTSAVANCRSGPTWVTRISTV
jgi:hypothetical protein